LTVDAELIVHGTTEPNARVTLQGEPAKLRPDGTFTIRFSLPDSRQIIPVVASSADGAEERTIVLAVERYTKELEPMIHDVDETSASGVIAEAPELSLAQPVSADRPTNMPSREKARSGEGGSTITELTIGDVSYRLQGSYLAISRTNAAGEVEYLVEGFEPLFVGRGENDSRAKADWTEQVHGAFQRLYRKMPFEMTSGESAQWSILERVVDVDAYNTNTPVVFRQLGKVSRSRHAPIEVTWTDGSKEAVNSAIAPAEFAGYELGQWFEALVERIPGSWQLRRILNVQATEPARRMPRERLRRFWDSLPTTNSLPKSSRDWTKT
jgi:hypothetical protein